MAPLFLMLSERVLMNCLVDLMPYASQTRVSRPQKNWAMVEPVTVLATSHRSCLHFLVVNPAKFVIALACPIIVGKTLSTYAFCCGVAWRSKGMKSVVLSTTDAEYMALSEVLKELKFIVELLQTMNI